MEIKVIKSSKTPEMLDATALGFGKIFSAHMFEMQYFPEKGWHNAKIKPFENWSVSPALATFHYGQSIFEGLKAYRTAKGKIQLFRPQENIARFNRSANRLCMPNVDETMFMDALKTLIKLDENFVPASRGASLYIRPFAFASDASLGVHPSHNYVFSIITSPSGSYYSTGLAPVKIYIEPEYVRAARGGVGFTKTSGNYAASLKAQDEAEKKGYAQVLWLDGKTHEYIEEVGAMNVFFVINGTVVTPKAEGSILEGITRKSAIELLKSKGYPVEERRLSLKELLENLENGTLTEAFGTGTAAVISPIGELYYDGKAYPVNNNKIGKISSLIYNTLTEIQYGDVPDSFGWVEPV